MQIRCNRIVAGTFGEFSYVTASLCVLGFYNLSKIQPYCVLSKLDILKWLGRHCYQMAHLEMKFGMEFCRDELSLELGLIHFLLVDIDRLHFSIGCHRPRKVLLSTAMVLFSVNFNILRLKLTFWKTYFFNFSIFCGF